MHNIELKKTSGTVKVSQNIYDDKFKCLFKQKKLFTVK